jgi:hypothetical protein
VDFDDLGLLLLGELGIIGTEARLQTDQTNDDEATRSLGHNLAYQRSRGVAIGETPAMIPDLRRVIPSG